MTDLPAATTARDERGSAYEVRCEGGGTMLGGAVSFLRVTPRLPDGADRLHLDGVAAEGRPIALPLR